MTKLVNIFMDFTKPGLDFDDFGKQIQSIFIELCPVDLVAEKETIDSMHKFQKFYFQICMDLMKEKIPFESIVIDQNTKKDWYDYYSKRIEENIALINNNPHNGTEQEIEYQRFLKERYEEFTSQRDKYSTELNHITDTLLKTEIEFKRKAVEKVIMMNQFLTEFIQSARTDLGLSQVPIEFSQVNTFLENVRSTTEATFDAVNKMNSEK